MANAEHLLTLIKQSERLKGNDPLRYRHLSSSPFLEGVDPLLPDFEENPETINEGDLCMYHWGEWKFIVPNGNHVGKRPLYYTDTSCASQRPIETEIPYRVAKNIPIQPMSLKPGEALSGYPVRTGQYLNSREGADTPLHVVDHSIRKLTDKYYCVEHIQTLDEVTFVENDGILANDYLIRSPHGIPIIISDFHQKLAGHIGQLILRDLLPNHIPFIDWMDDHDDGRMSPELQKFSTMEELVQACESVNCAHAASILRYADKGNFRFYDHMAVLSMPSWGQHINPFDYQTPFGRVGNLSHVLSFDLDQLNNFCSYKRCGDIDYELDKSHLSNYMQWLSERGMNAGSYDAVMLYTSPGYCWPQAARDGIQALYELF